MIFELEITFTGLIAFVPMTKNGEVIYNVRTTAPHHVWALLLDGQNPPPGSDRIVIDAHFPALRYNVANIAKKPGPGHNCTGKPGYRAYFVAGMEIILPPPTDGDALRVVTTGAGDFGHLVSLSEVVPKVKPDVSYFGANPPVAARLRIERGTLQTSSLEACGKKIGFDPPGSWAPRPVARDMKLTIRGLRDSVTIGVKPISGSGQSSRLNLVPSDGGKVNIELMNSPMPLIKKGRHTMRSGRHFEMFWQFVNSPGTKAIPKGHRKGADKRPGTAPADYCPDTADMLCPEIRP